jgi:hypothetical protein
MTDLIRFRCTRCNTSLKVSGAKVGTRVACPKCGLELTIPDQASQQGETVAMEAAAGARVEGPGEAGDAMGPGLGLLNLDLRLDPSPAVQPSATAVKPAPTPATPKAPSVVPTPAPPASSASGENLSLRPERMGNRGRDVVLPRTAAVAYTTFSLLGLLFAFFTGLLLGHFVWR